MLSRLSVRQIHKLVRPSISQPTICGVIVSSRGKATGDNSVPFIPVDTGFTTDDCQEIMATPPAIPTLQEQLVDSIEEVAKSEKLDDAFATWFGKSMPTIHDDKDPSRDVVNFPRPVLTTYPEARRLFLIPDSWFRALYPKIGVTGPYTLTFGLLAFCLSKEYIIYEAELNIGVYMCVLLAIGINKFGSQANAHLQKLRDTQEYLWYSWQKDAIARLNDYIEATKKNQSSLDGQGILFDAKRENLALQAEAEYRRRLQVVYNEVKRKLDYQSATDQAKKQFEQNHMVNWILNSVEEAVSRQSEKDILAKCVSDLKALAVARKGAI